MRSRDYRIAQENKKKNAVKKYSFLNYREKIDEKLIGKISRTPVNCSCHLCGNPRKYYNRDTIQEQKIKTDKEWV